MDNTFIIPEEEKKVEPTQKLISVSEAVDDVLSEDVFKRARMVHNLQQSFKLNADQENKLMQDAALTGVPIDSARANPNTVATAADAIRLKEKNLQETAPASQQFFENPQNARIAHDDLDNIVIGEHLINEYIANDEAMSSVLTFGSDMTRHFAAGLVGDTIKGVGSIASMATQAAVNYNMESELYDPSASYDELVERLQYGNVMGRVMSKNLGADWIVETGTAIGDYITGDVKDRYGSDAKALLGGSRSLGGLVAAMGTSFVTKNPSYALSWIGTTTAGNTFVEDMKKGMQFHQAMWHGVADGAIEWGTEMLPVTRLIKDAMRGTPLFQMFLRNLAREVPTEILATIGQTFTSKSTDVDWNRLLFESDFTTAGKAFSEWVREMPQNIWETMLATSVMSAGFATMGRISHLRAAKDTATAVRAITDVKEEEAFVKSMNIGNLVQRIIENATESKLSKRASKIKETLVRSMTDGTPVTHAYIDRETWDVYWQEQGAEPGVMAQGYGVVNYAEAETMLVIPYEKFTTGFATTPHAISFVNDIKLSVDGMTQRERTKYAEEKRQLAIEFGETLSRMQDDAESAQHINDAVSRLAEDVTKALEPKYGNEASKHATIMSRAFVHTVGRELLKRSQEKGVELTPEELVNAIEEQRNAFNLTIEARSIFSEYGKSQEDMDAKFNSAIEKIRKGERFGDESSNNFLDHLTAELNDAGIDVTAEEFQDIEDIKSALQNYYDAPPMTMDEALGEVLYQMQNLEEWRANTEEFFKEAYKGYYRDKDGNVIDFDPEIAERLKAMDAQVKAFKAFDKTLRRDVVGANVQKESVKAGFRSFGPIRFNSDDIYIISFDASSSCVKRLIASSTAEIVAKEIGRPLTIYEQLALTGMLRLKGIDAPCLYCYVEAPRNKAAEAVARGINAIILDKIPKSWKDQRAERARLAKSEFDSAFSEWYSAQENPEQDITKARREFAKANINGMYSAVPASKANEGAWENVSRFPAVYDFLDREALSTKQNQVRPYEEYVSHFLSLGEEQVELLNGYAGVRFFSTSDFQIEHVVDLVQAMWDLNAVQAKSHSYTKVPLYVDIFGNTGQKINMSLFAKESTDKNGNKIFEADTSQGWDFEEAKKRRKKSPDVGSVMIATTDDIVRWSLDTDWIDYCIPFHSSGIQKKIFGELGWQNYQGIQSEKSMIGLKSKEIQKIRMHELRVTTESGEVKSISTGITNKEGTEAYLRLCMERKLFPVFTRFIFKEKMSTKKANAKWREIVNSGNLNMDEINPNFFKLKKDFARTDTPFNVINPKNIDMKIARRELKKVLDAPGGLAEKYKGNDEVAQDLINLIRTSSETALQEKALELINESKKPKTVQNMAVGLYNKDAVLASAGQPPTILNQGGDVSTLYQFIGEQGASRLDAAMRDGYVAGLRMDNLNIAKEMESAGKEAKAIKLATGWEKGTDGKWRYEIDDSLINIEGYRSRILSEGTPEYWLAHDALWMKRLVENGTPVDQVKKQYRLRFDKNPADGALQIARTSLLEDLEEQYKELRANIDQKGKLVHYITEEAGKELYTAYPELRDYNVVLVDDADRGGFFDPSTKTIAISLHGSASHERMRLTLVHEIQHAIQNIEGFAFGISPEAVSELKNKKEEDAAKLFRKIRQLRGQIPGFKEAFAASKAEMDAKQKTVKEHLADMTRLIEESEQSEAINEARKTMEEINRKWDEIFKGAEDPYEIYLRVAGEVEARNAENRIEMTPEERLRSLAVETEDVAREDQIILEQSLREAASIERVLYQAGWHGSPYNFDFFSFAHMGAGEGAQAHGWGGYIALERFVAEGYRKRLGGGRRVEFTLAGEPLPGFLEEKLYTLFSWKATEDKDTFKKETPSVIEKIKKKIETDFPEKGLLSREREERRILLELASALESGQIEMTISGIGQLYEVDIPEDDVLLDEQKTFKEQPAKVQEALRKLGTIKVKQRFVDYNGETYQKLNKSIFGDWIAPDGKRVPKKSELYSQLDSIADTAYEKEAEVYIFNEEETGKEIYSRLVEEYGSPKEASLALNSAGVKGITYVGDMDGRCFVIFDEKAIEILNKYYQDQLLKKGSSAPLGAFDKTRMRIDLFENADASTFVHETAHFMLEVYTALASHAQASEYIKKEIATIRQFVGNDGGAWTREQHEKFAQAFEAYLMEGKSPSNDETLKGVFRSFRIWMKDIYTRLRKLDVKINDDIREVFDRMIASDAEIETLKIKERYAPIFTSAEDIGVTQEEFDAYLELCENAIIAGDDKLRSRAMRSIRSRRTKEARQIIASLEKQCTKEFDESPAGRLLTLFTGEDRTQSLNREDLLRYYDISVIDQIQRKSRRKVFSDEGEITAELLEGSIEEYGFNSFDEMINALVNLPNRNEWIKREAKARFDREHGEVLNAENIAEEAELALQNELYDQKVRRELGVLNYLAKAGRASRRVAEEEAREEQKAAVKEAVAQEKEKQAEEKRKQRELRAEAKAIEQAINNQYKLLKDIAKRSIAVSQVKNLSPNIYLRAMTKASNDAKRALQKATPDYLTAASAKRTELLNSLMYREAMRVKQELTRKTTAARKIARKSLKDAVRTRTSYGVLKAKYIAAVAGLSGNAEQLLADIRTEEKHSGIAEPFEYEVKAPLRDMMTEDALQVLSDIDAQWKLSRLDKVVEIDGKKIEKDKVAEELVIAFGKFTGELDERETPAQAKEETSEEEPEAKQEALSEEEEAKRKEAAKLASEKITLKDRIKWLDIAKAINTAKNSMIRAEAFFSTVDGSRVGEAMGPWMKYIYVPIRKASDRAQEKQATYTKRLADILKQFNFKREKITSAELGFTFGETTGYGKAELIHALLHTGNESNMERLLLGFGWGERLPSGIVSRERFDSAIAKLIEDKRLTKEDFDLVQQIWDIFEELKPGSQKAHMAVFGRYFSEITASPFEQFGTVYAGGYVPAIYDYRKTQTGDKQLIEDIGLDTPAMSMTFPHPKAGWGISRKERVEEPLLLDLATLGSHLKKQIIFSEMAPVNKDVSSLLNRRDVDAVVRDYDPDFMKGVIAKWLTRAVSQNMNPGGSALPYLDAVRSRVGVASLFANVVNVTEQALDFTAAMQVVGAKNLAGSLMDVVGNREQIMAEIFEKSPYMRNRVKSEVMAANSAVRQALDPSLMMRADQFMMNNGYFMQSFVDSLMSPVVWHAAYNKAISAGIEESEAINQADSAVRQTLGASSFADVSNFEAGGPLARVFTQFTGFFLQRLNMTVAEIRKATRRSDKLSDQTIAASIIAFRCIVLSAWLSAMVRVTAYGAGGDDDDGEFMNWITEVFGFGLLNFTASMVPIAGQAVNIVVDQARGKSFGNRMLYPPVFQAINELAFMFTKPSKRWEDGDIAGLVHYLLGLSLIVPWVPVIPRRPVASAKYLVDTMTDRVEPSSTLDFIRGTITGRASEGTRQ